MGSKVYGDRMTLTLEKRGDTSEAGGREVEKAKRRLTLMFLFSP